MSFKGIEIETVKFELVETYTWGVEKNIRKGYSIPVSVNDEEVKSKIEELVKKYDAKDPLYGRGEEKTLYLRSKNLSSKQKEELLDKELMYVFVQFEAWYIFTDKDGNNHLCFRVTKLRKLDKSPPEILCPED